VAVRGEWSSLSLAMPRSLPRLCLRLRRLSQRKKCQRRSSILKTRMRTTRSALAGPAPPSPLLPHQSPHHLPHQLSPQLLRASVSILPPLHGAYASAELAGIAIIMAASSVLRVSTMGRGRCTYVARVSPTSSGSSSETVFCSDFRRGSISLELFSR